MRNYIWEEDQASKILILDDTEKNRRMFEVLIPSYKQFKYSVVSVATPDEARKQLEEISLDLCAFLVDQRLGQDDQAGLDLLSFVTSRYPDIPVVIYTGTRLYKREEAVKRGALLYVPLEEMARSSTLVEVMLNLFGRIRDAGHLRAQFQRIIDALQDELAVLDTKGRVLMLNKQKLDKFNLGSCEYYGIECWKLFKDQKCLAIGGRPDDCPVKIVTEDPARRQYSAPWHNPESHNFYDNKISITASAIMDQKDHEKVSAVVESVRPLTKMEQLSTLIEEFQKYDKLVDEGKIKRNVISLLQYAADKLNVVIGYSRVRMYLREFMDDTWQMVCKACSGMP
jgi:CheY-like chemotaxis protein